MTHCLGNLRPAVALGEFSDIKKFDDGTYAIPAIMRNYHSMRRMMRIGLRKFIPSTRHFSHQGASD